MTMHVNAQFQDLFLGFGLTTTGGGGIADLRVESSRNRILERLNVSVSVRSEIRIARVHGDALFASNETNTANAAAGMPASAFAPTALVDESNNLGYFSPEGVAVNLQVAAVTPAALTVTAAYGTDDPNADQLNQHLANKGIGLSTRRPGSKNWLFGMGSVVVAAGAAGVLAVDAARDCVLGRLIVDAATAVVGDLMITSITIHRDELLSSDDQIDSLILSPFSSDEDGLLVAHRMRPSQRFSIAFFNNSVAPIEVGAGLFCLK